VTTAPIDFALDRTSANIQYASQANMAIHTAAIGVNLRHTMHTDSSPAGSLQSSPQGKRKRADSMEQVACAISPIETSLKLEKKGEGLTVVTAEACGPGEIDPVAPTYAVSSVISLSPADAVGHQKFPMASVETSLEEALLPAAHAEVAADLEVVAHAEVSGA